MPRHACSAPILMGNWEESEVGSKSALIVAGIALLVIAPLQWLLFPEYRRGVVSVHDATVMGVIGGVGLILFVVGLLLRFRRPSQPYSTPAAVTAGGQSVPPVIGYTPDGQPVTANQPLGYQSDRPTNTMAIVTIIVSLLFSLLAIPLGHIALKQIKATGEQGKILAVIGLVIGYTSLAALLIAGTIFVVGTSRGWYR